MTPKLHGGLSTNEKSRPLASSVAPAWPRSTTTSMRPRRGRILIVRFASGTGKIITRVRRHETDSEYVTTCHSIPRPLGVVVSVTAEERAIAGSARMVERCREVVLSVLSRRCARAWPSLDATETMRSVRSAPPDRAGWDRRLPLDDGLISRRLPRCRAA